MSNHDLEPNVRRTTQALLVQITGVRELADGVHPFLSSPDHTFEARRILGPGKLIAVELGVVLDPDRRRARDAARANLERFLRWPNYRNHFQRLGYEDSDLAGGGNDRLRGAGRLAPHGQHGRVRQDASGASRRA